MKERHILVVGSGSVGKRHMRNLASLGCRISAMDPRQDRLDEAAAETELVSSYTTLDRAMADVSSFDGVVIGSPPSVHVDQCVALAEKGVPILLEKPVSPDLDGARRLGSALDETGCPLLLGYTYRWWEPLGEFRDAIGDGRIGRPYHARFVMSAHLADWHPWERYQDFFMASKALGGGALLDESHFIDLMLWFFGMPENLFARVEKLSSLEIDTDDNVDVLAFYPDNLRVSIHLDLYGRPHEKYISVTGDDGTIEWSFDPNRIRWSSKAEHVWEEKSYGFERNDMFVNVAREFLDLLDGKRDLTCAIGDGIRALEVIEACRESTETGSIVRPGG